VAAATVGRFGRIARINIEPFIINIIIITTIIINR
jgi:hypothetical protein